MKTELKPIPTILGLLLSSTLVTACGGGGGGGSEGNPSPVNTAPEIIGIAASFVQVSRAYSFVPDAYDADGDALSFTVKNLPAWAHFDEATGELSGEPDEPDVGLYEDITISVSDGQANTTLAAFSVDVLEAPLGRNSIDTTNAAVTPTDTGYHAQGDIFVTSGDNSTALTDADLKFEFDAGDNLVNVTGTALLPTAISDYLQIENPMQVKVGFYTGAEINQDDDIGIDSPGGIRLMEQRRYLVYFIGADFGITFKDKSNPDQVPITLGIGEAQSLIVMDPTDPFSYAFGYYDGLGRGKGKSSHGLIPYQPIFDEDNPDAFAELDSFYGHKVEKGIFPLSIKVFDVLSLSGSRVIRDPQFSDIDWTDPFNSAIHYQAGYSGQADLEFGVLGVGLFSYQLAQMSATFDVGLQRQHMAMQGVYQPTETSQPVWLPVRPSPEPFDKVVANIFADGSGDFAMELRGQFESSFPEAELHGSMVQTLDRLTLTGRIDDEVNPIDVSAETDADTFNAKVHYAVDINAGLQSKVESEMDAKLAEVEAATAKLEEATAGYEFAASLEGAREHLPEIADTAIVELNKIPGAVYNSVHKSVRDYINSGQYCVTKYGPCYKYKDYVNANSVANTAAAAARDDAEETIAPYVTALTDMKAHANHADYEMLRASLKAALLEVHNRQTINKTISYTYSKKVDYGVGSFTIKKTFSYTINQRVITSEQATTVKAAADNVDKIGPADEVVIDVGKIVEELPTEEAIGQAKREVQGGLRQVPRFDGAGYSVSADDTRSAYIVLSGEKHAIEFNLLDPTSAPGAIVEFITLTIVGR